MKKLAKTLTNGLLLAGSGEIDNLWLPIKNLVNSNWIAILTAMVVLIIICCVIFGFKYATAKTEENAEEQKKALKRGIIGLAIIVGLTMVIFVAPDIIIAAIENSGGGSDIWQ